MKGWVWVEAVLDRDQVHRDPNDHHDGLDQ
jgi:hypothetical protein